MAVCPHCWEINHHAQRLCGRCGADMHLVLQESGGLRMTAPVQSPMPVRARDRLSPVQRTFVLCVVLVLFAVQVLVAIYASNWRATPAARVPTEPAVPGSTGG